METALILLVGLPLVAMIWFAPQLIERCGRRVRAKMLWRYRCWRNAVRGAQLRLDFDEADRLLASGPDRFVNWKRQI